jgi:leader peptidase (prepilin peptidase) / N-methyltransferase
MTLLVSMLIFILGTAIGSFLSVVIYRVHSKKKGIMTGRSVCPHCNKKLKAHHLVPIFSWLFLRGKCGFCGKKISAHYLSLELITGLTLLAAFLYWNFLIAVPSTVAPEFFTYIIDWQIFERFTFYIIEFILLIAIFFYDLQYQEIPDRFSLPAIGVAIAGGLVFGVPSAISMLIGAIILFLFFFIQFVVSKGRWIGGGDLRMGVLMGVLLGWQMGLFALMIAYLFGAFISIFMLMTARVTRKTAIAFGPFLIIGTLIMMFFGDPILNAYLTLLT